MTDFLTRSSFCRFEIREAAAAPPPETKTRRKRQRSDREEIEDGLEKQEAAAAPPQIPGPKRRRGDVQRILTDERSRRQ